MTVDMIDRIYQDTGYLLDPHTAIGLAAAKACHSDPGTPMVTLATAHPAKFPDAVRQAGFPEDPLLPAHMADLFDRDEAFTVLENDQTEVHRFITENISI
jgi:threonine synthase